MPTKHASLARTRALANCTQGHHQWYATFTLGEKVCTVCGALASCPFCVSRPPAPNVKLIACALHRERRAEA